MNIIHSDLQTLLTSGRNERANATQKKNAMMDQIPFTQGVSQYPFDTLDGGGGGYLKLKIHAMAENIRLSHDGPGSANTRSGLVLFRFARWEGVGYQRTVQEETKKTRGIKNALLRG